MLRFRDDPPGVPPIVPDRMDAVCVRAGDIGGQAVSDEGGLAGQDPGHFGKACVKECLLRLRRADVLGREDPAETGKKPRVSEAVRLLLHSGICGDVQGVLLRERPDQFLRAGFLLMAFGKGGTVVGFESRGIAFDAKTGKDRLPSDGVQSGPRQTLLLEFLSQKGVDLLEDVSDPVRERDALPAGGVSHGSSGTELKREQRIVHVEKNRPDPRNLSGDDIRREAVPVQISSTFIRLVLPLSPLVSPPVITMRSPF